MNTLQATLKIQHAWRSHTFIQYAYRYCFRCDNVVLCKKKNYIGLCKPCCIEVDKIEKDNLNWRRGKGPKPKEIIHPCNDYFCSGDCGVLICGCIDMCRGRCGTPRNLIMYNNL